MAFSPVATIYYLVIGISVAAAFSPAATIYYLVIGTPVAAHLEALVVLLAAELSHEKSPTLLQPIYWF